MSTPQFHIKTSSFVMNKINGYECMCAHLIIFLCVLQGGITTTKTKWFSAPSTRISRPNSGMWRLYERLLSYRIDPGCPVWSSALRAVGRRSRRAPVSSETRGHTRSTTAFSCWTMKQAGIMGNVVTTTKHAMKQDQGMRLWTLLASVLEIYFQ